MRQRRTSPEQRYIPRNEAVKHRRKRKSHRWAIKELGIQLSELARKLKMSPAGIEYAVQRGEEIARQGNYELLG